MDLTPNDVDVEKRIKDGRKSLEAIYKKEFGNDGKLLAPGAISKAYSIKDVADLVEPGKLEVTIGAYIRDALVAVDSTGQKYYERFIKAFLKEALDDPAGYCGRQLSSGIINESMFKTLDSQSSKSKDDEREFIRFKLRNSLYTEQQEVFDDIYDSTIMMICSRRSGKTELNIRLIVSAILRGFPVLYLNKTISNAISQTYDSVLDVLTKHNISIKDKSKSEGYIKLSDKDIKGMPNLEIRWAGMNDISSLDKLRGFHFGLVIIDECGHIKNGNYLLDEVVRPMTADYLNSQIILSGTPPRTKGFAYNLWHNDKIRHFHWTAEKNPFIPDFREFIDKVCIEKGFVKEDDKGNTIPDYSIPFIQREYFGNMDAFDVDALVFKGYKTYDSIPSTFYPNKAFIGIDWGFYDHFALVSFLYDSISNKAYVTKVYAKGKLGVEDKKSIIHKEYIHLVGEMHNRGFDNSVTVIADNNQPDIMLDLWREGVLIYKAYKSDMMESVEELSSLLRTGRVLVPNDNNELTDDLERTVYDRDENDALIPAIDDASYHPNAVHALRYAVRYAFNNEVGETAGNISEFNIDTQMRYTVGNIKEEHNSPFDYTNMSSSAFDD